MKSIAYGACLGVVGGVAILRILAYLLNLVHLPLPLNSSFGLFLGYFSLVPPMLSAFVPRFLQLLLTLIVALLAGRRIWLLATRKEGWPPAAFTGVLKWLGIVGLWSLGLGLVVLLFSILLKAGSGVPAGLVMLPAVICLPWGFFVTEGISLWQALRRPPGTT